MSSEEKESIKKDTLDIFWKKSFIDRVFNLFKILSVLFASYVLSFKIGMYGQQIIYRLDKIETYNKRICDLEDEIKILKEWKREVTAYYLPKK